MHPQGIVSKLAKVVYLVAFLGNSAVCGQGLNNSWALDQEDLQSSLGLLNISIFKFLLPTDSTLKINLIIEEFKDKKIIQESNSMESLEKTIGAGALDFLPSRTSEDSLNRMYFQRRGSVLTVLQKIGSIERRLEIPLSDSIALWGLRAMSMPRAQIKNSKIPLVVFYANRPGKTKLDCPSDAPVTFIRETYDYGLIFYEELLGP